MKIEELLRYAGGEEKVGSKGSSSARPAAKPCPMSISRVFANVNKELPASYWDYENLHVNWNPQDPYYIIDKVGRGKYSDVFSGYDSVRQARCIIKVLKPVRLKKIKREIQILRNLADGPNIVQLLDLVIEPDTQTPAFVFEAVENVDHRTLYPTLSDLDVRFYMFQLLRALHFAHSKGIMHRDVKPHNVMIDPKRRQLRLIDWGLGEFYHPGVPYIVRVASRYYKGPELLVEFTEYDYSLDLWSFGCMFGGIILQRETLFHGRDNDEQMVKIVQVLGMEDFNSYLDRYSIEYKLVKPHHYVIPQRRISWKTFRAPKNEHLSHDMALDLLDRLLRYDHQERLTAAEAMAHPYFDPVRETILAGQQPIGVGLEDMDTDASN